MIFRYDVLAITTRGAVLSAVRRQRQRHLYRNLSPIRLNASRANKSTSKRQHVMLFRGTGERLVHARCRRTHHPPPQPPPFPDFQQTDIVCRDYWQFARTQNTGFGLSMPSYRTCKQRPVPAARNSVFGPPPRQEKSRPAQRPS